MTPDYSVFPLPSQPNSGSGGKTEPFTASDVLLKAASRIEEEGMWCQGLMFAGEQACALGHLEWVSRELGANFLQVQDVLEHYLYQHDAVPSNSDLCPVAAWNDTPGRTAHEVADAMRQAAM